MLRVTANSRNSRPTISLMKQKNQHCHQRNAERENRKTISFEPRSEACSGVIPFIDIRLMFSIITMASSTTKSGRDGQRQQRQIV